MIIDFSFINLGDKLATFNTKSSNLNPCNKPLLTSPSEIEPNKILSFFKINQTT